MVAKATNFARETSAVFLMGVGQLEVDRLTVCKDVATTEVDESGLKGIGCKVTIADFDPVSHDKTPMEIGRSCVSLFLGSIVDRTLNSR